MAAESQPGGHFVAQLLGPPGLGMEVFRQLLHGVGVVVVSSEEPGDLQVAPHVIVLVQPGPEHWNAVHDVGVPLVLVEGGEAADDADVVDSVLAGADAVLHCDSDPERVLAVMAAVSRGGSVMEPAQVRLVVDLARAAGVQPGVVLSRRETEILSSIADGKAVKQTARDLGMETAPSVVIAHDDDLVRDMLRLACDRAGVLVIGEALSYGDLLHTCGAVHPDVTVTADRLGGSLVEHAVSGLVSTGTRVIVLSSDPSPERMSQLMARDLCGYLSYDAGPDEVVGAIVAVGRGEVALNPEVLTTIIHQWRRLRAQPVSAGLRRRPVLTPRELDILAAMSDGLAAKAIAERLGVALKTVENHKIRIFEKLGVRSHAHAVTVALAYGMTGPPPTDSADVQSR